MLTMKLRDVAKDILMEARLQAVVNEKARLAARKAQWLKQREQAEIRQAFRDRARFLGGK